MQSVVGIPHPVIGPEGCAPILVHLTIPSTIVAAILRDVDHALVATVQSRVERRALILRATLDADLSQRLVPCCTTLGYYLFQIEMCDLVLQVLAGLIGRDI